MKKKREKNRKTSFKLQVQQLRSNCATNVIINVSFFVVKSYDKVVGKQYDE